MLACHNLKTTFNIYIKSTHFSICIHNLGDLCVRADAVVLLTFYVTEYKQVSRTTAVSLTPRSTKLSLATSQGAKMNFLRVVKIELPM